MRVGPRGVPPAAATLAHPLVRGDADRVPFASVTADPDGAAPSPSPPLVPVVAAVIRRDTSYLVALRPAHKRHGGLWEFPGGKVREGESAADALERELAEELGAAVTGTGALLFQRRDPGSPYLICFVEATIDGEPEAREHQEVRWAPRPELAAMDLAPADAAFVREVVLGIG